MYDRMAKKHDQPPAKSDFDMPALWDKSERGRPSSGDVGIGYVAGKAEPEKRFFVHAPIEYLTSEVILPGNVDHEEASSSSAISQVLGVIPQDQFLVTGAAQSSATQETLAELAPGSSRPAVEHLCDGIGGCSTVLIGGKRDKDRNWKKATIKVHNRTYYYCNDCFRAGKTEVTQ